MASITIRNLDDAVKQRLRVQAAVHGRSMEDEARAILRDGVSQPARAPKGLGTDIHDLFAEIGVELELPLREPVREPPRFS